MERVMRGATFKNSVDIGQFEKELQKFLNER